MMQQRTHASWRLATEHCTFPQWQRVLYIDAGVCTIFVRMHFLYMRPQVWICEKHLIVDACWTKMEPAHTCLVSQIAQVRTGLEKRR